MTFEQELLVWSIMIPFIVLWWVGAIRLLTNLIKYGKLKL